MTCSKLSITAASLLLAFLPLSATLAQQSTGAFNSQKFWERLELERRGSASSTPFDAKAFFEKLDAERRSVNAPLDARSFFDRLANAEGRRMPEGFDAKKFFEKLDAERRTIPASIDTTMTDPTTADCKSGWSEGRKWGEVLFNRLCQNIR